MDIFLIWCLFGYLAFNVWLISRKEKKRQAWENRQRLMRFVGLPKD